MKRLLIFLFFPSLLVAAPSEQPKELRTAEEMIQDGLGRDAATRIRAWLQKNNGTPQPFAQVLLAEALLMDRRPEEALNELPKNSTPEWDNRIRFTRASALNELGRWNEATPIWKELKAKGNNEALTAKATYGLATALLNENESATGLLELKELLKDRKNPVNHAARLLLIKTLLSDGKIEEAEKELSSFPEDAPGPIKAEARYWTAEVALSRGKSDEAREQFRKILETKEGTSADLIARIWIAIGKIDRSRNKPADASNSLEKALDQNSEPETYLTAAREYLAAAQASQSLPTAALKLRDSVRDREEESEKRGRFAPALLLLGSATLAAGNAEAAAADLDQLIRTYPASPSIPSARLLLAQTLVKQGQESAAKEQLKTLLQIPKLDPTVFYQAQAAQAEILLKEGKAAEASAAWISAYQASTDPKLAEEALYNSALTASRGSDASTFLRLEQEFSQRFPDSSRRAALALERGRMLETQGDSTASRSALAEVSKLPGSNPLQAEATLRRASSLLRGGDYTGAIAAFSDFEKAFPNSPLLPQALASGIEARLRSKEMTGAQARVEFTKILNRFPNSTLAPAITFQIAQTHYEERNHGEALTAFREMATKYPKDPLADNALYYAAQSALALGNPAEAIKLLRLIPENSPLRLDARLAEIDASRASGDYSGGLQIANSLLASRTPDQRPWVEVTKRRLACEFALGANDRASLERAASTAASLIASPISDSAERNEAGFIRGKCLEQLGREEDALQAYLDVLYGRSGTQPAGVTQPEYLWFARAGAEAARIQESRRDFRGALAIYRILEKAGGPNQAAFARKIDDLRNRYFLWSEQ
jgi:TolA-binding protein